MNSTKALIALCLIALGYPSVAQAGDAGGWEATCEKVQNVSIPDEDELIDGAERALANCDSEALYYGIGQPANYTRARHCAYLEKQEGDDHVFGGSAILMMLYANSLGVAKNIPLAKQFACNIDGAVAEKWGRLEHLDKLEGSAKSEQIDLCDDITSGYMIGFCSAHNERMARIELDIKTKSITAKWSIREKTAYEKLSSVSNRFIDVRSLNEIDQTGTMRAALVAEETAIQEADFIQLLETLEARKVPKYTSVQFKDEDRELNVLYQKIQKRKDDVVSGSITRDGIKLTQRIWLKYRDAWIAFANVKYPAFSSDSIATWITIKRNKMLRDLIPL